LVGSLGEFRDQALGWQIGNAIRSVVKHLGHHFSSNARIRCTFHFHQYRDAFAIYEQMIERPAVGTVLFAGHAKFAADKQ